MALSVDGVEDVNADGLHLAPSGHIERRAILSQPVVIACHSINESVSEPGW